MFWLTGYTGIEQLIVVATIVFLTVLLAEIFDCTKFFSCIDIARFSYGYEPHNGPTTWKCLYPKCKGKYQSPINVLTQNSVCVPSETLKPMKFSSEYYSMPCSVIAMNDGHGLVVHACWSNNTYPTLSGGCLKDTYRFDSARFRWGATDEEGSEHTIDSMRYAMEVQAVHVKTDRHYYDVLEAAENKAVLCVSYFFEITPVDNPYLEPLLSALKNIQLPCTHCIIDPFPLCWIILPFQSKYFSYCGSLTYPPCTENVEWMLQSEPLSISSRQVKKFRKLCSVDGPLASNTRPVQEMYGRDVCFYD